MIKVRYNWRTADFKKRKQMDTYFKTLDTMDIMKTGKELMMTWGMDVVEMKFKNDSGYTERIRIWRPEELKRQLSII